MSAVPIRVMCFDDNDLVCEALQRKLCAPEFEFAGYAFSTADLVELAEARRPDVVLVDLCIPGDDPVASVRRLKRRLPAMRIAALTGMLDETSIARTLGAGADGYISKSEDSKTIVESVRRLAAGEFVLSPDVRAVYDGPLDPRPAPIV